MTNDQLWRFRPPPLTFDRAAYRRWYVRQKARFLLRHGAMHTTFSFMGTLAAIAAARWMGWL